jgi:hypothetical protein
LETARGGKLENRKNSEMLKSETPIGIEKRKTAHISASRLLYFGRVCGDRTHDKRIKSPLLYQLS